jgi:hypothetical protein
MQHLLLKPIFIRNTNMKHTFVTNDAFEFVVVPITLSSSKGSLIEFDFFIQFYKNLYGLLKKIFLLKMTNYTV